jgi:hypothetical protein
MMIRFYELFDGVPILGVLVAFTLLALIALEGGFRLGSWWQNRQPHQQGDPTAMIVGSLLALMGFLLAITTGMASDRFDKRRELVLSEANSVGTTYLRAGYLDEPASGEIRELLREYVALRIASPHALAEFRTRMEQAAQLHTQLWSIAEGLARAHPESQVLALFIDSLNQTIDLHEMRATAGVVARVPLTVLLLLFCGSIMTLSMVGYNAGLSQQRSPLSALTLILLLGLVITLVIDLDRSQGGLLKVSQQPLLDLQQQIGPPQHPRSEQPQT